MQGDESGRAPRNGERWTDEERRYLIAHAPDGYIMLAMALGRSENAVRSQADKMGVTITMRPRLGGICPLCGLHRLREGGHKHAYRMGVCPSCYESLKADALGERVDMLREYRRYQATKASLRRERAKLRKLGLEEPPGGERSGAKARSIEVRTGKV